MLFLEESGEDEAMTPCDPDQLMNPVNIAGVICLCYADGIDPSRYYNNKG